MSHQSRVWPAYLLVGSLGLAISVPGGLYAKISSSIPSQAPSVEQRALALLDQLSAAAKDIKDDELGIRLQLQIAVILWDYDERRARGLFSNAFQAVAAAKLPTGPDYYSPPAYPGADARFPLRSEILRMVAPRDPELAQAMVGSILNDPPDASPKPSTEPDGIGNDRAHLHMVLAMHLLDVNRERAIEAARNGLRQSISVGSGLSSQFVMFLRALGNRDRAAADRLFLFALTAAQRDPAHFAGSIGSLSDYAFPGYGGVPHLSFPGRNPMPPQEASPSTTESFLNFVYNAITRATASATSNPSTPGWSASDYAAVRLLLPYFDKRMPDQAAALRAKLDEIVRGYPPGPDRDRLTNQANPSSPQDQENGADSARTQEQKDSLYRMAVMLHISNSEYDQAISVARKIGAAGLRSSTIVQIVASQARNALQTQDFDGAYRYAREIPDPRERASVLCAIAQMICSKDRARAGELTREASLLIDALELNPLNLQAAVELACAREALDPETSFDDARALVDQINRIGFAPEWVTLKTTAVRTEDAVIPWKMNYGLSLIPFDRIFAPLARADFDRAALLAQTITLKEATILAQLSVCRAVLARPRAPQSPARARTTPALFHSQVFSIYVDA